MAGVAYITQHEQHQEAGKPRHDPSFWVALSLVPAMAILSLNDVVEVRDICFCSPFRCLKLKSMITLEDVSKSCYVLLVLPTEVCLGSDEYVRTRGSLEFKYEKSSCPGIATVRSFTVTHWGRPARQFSH